VRIKPNRFRFRAWDARHGRMRYAELGRHAEFFELGDLQDVMCSGPDTGRYKPILMQSTGLADKNGKEIFEGDVVRRTVMRADNSHEVLWGDVSIIRFVVGAIVKDNESYGNNQVSSFLRDMIEGDCQGELAHLDFNSESWTRVEAEILGNIYENPELLSQRKE